MKIVFCTSFGQSYYDHVASHTLPYLVTSTINHELNVYYENEITLKPNINAPHVKYHNLFHCSPGLIKFLSEIKDNPYYRGEVYKEDDKAVWNHKMIEANYNYRLNAFLFSRKWFALKACYDLAALCNEQFILIWLDADTLTLDYFDDIEKDINEVMNQDQLIGYLARDFIHSECGAVIFKSSEIAHYVINEVCRYYSDGDFKKLDEYNDCHVFDCVMNTIDSKYHCHLALGHYGEDVYSKSLFDKYGMHLKGVNKHKVNEVIEDVKRNTEAYRVAQQLA